MSGSIGQIAEAILSEVKTNKLIKLAQQTIIKEAAARPAPTTDIGKMLYKLAAEVRNGNTEISIADVKQFVKELENAI